MSTMLFLLSLTLASASSAQCQGADCVSDDDVTSLLQTQTGLETRGPKDEVRKLQQEWQQFEADMDDTMAVKEVSGAENNVIVTAEASGKAAEEAENQRLVGKHGEQTKQNVALRTRKEVIKGAIKQCGNRRIGCRCFVGCFLEHLGVSRTDLRDNARWPTAHYETACKPQGWSFAQSDGEVYWPSGITPSQWGRKKQHYSNDPNKVTVCMSDDAHYHVWAVVRAGWNGDWNIYQANGYNPLGNTDRPEAYDSYDDIGGVGKDTDSTARAFRAKRRKATPNGPAVPYRIPEGAVGPVETARFDPTDGNPADTDVQRCMVFTWCSAATNCERLPQGKSSFP